MYKRQAGLDFVVFAICLWLVDGRGFKRAGKPLAIMGMNAITVYMISELLDEALSVLCLLYTSRCV